jgi:hypothetical protein
MAAFPTSPSTNDTHSYGGTTFKWNGTGWEIVPGAVNLVASGGGTEATSGGYKYHTFTSSGTLVVTTPGLVDALIIGGGGAGNSGYAAAGGGAGGLNYIPSLYLPSGNVAIVVGAGGSADADATEATAGGDSSINGEFFGYGGGPGANNNVWGASLTTWVFGGGSGGGCGALSCFPAGYGVPGQGNHGGSGEYGYRGGGGGGAGSVGQNADDQGGDGGTGLNTYSAWATATSTGDNGYYCSGGGGTILNGTGGTASDGGGTDSSTGQATNAAANLGGGGGAGGGSSPFNDLGANGGSGLVIVRYAV